MIVYKQENKNVVQETINILTKHWISHNVYPKAKSNVRKMVDELWREYHSLRWYPQEKKTKPYWARYKKFVKQSIHLFDIIGSNLSIGNQEKLHNLKMTKDDWQFYENMKKVPQVGFSGGVDQGWKALSKRNEKREEIKIKQKERAEEYRKNQEFRGTFPESEDESPCSSAENPSFLVQHIESSNFADFREHPQDDLPQNYRRESRGKICKIPILSDHDRTEK